MYQSGVYFSLPPITIRPMKRLIVHNAANSGIKEVIPEENPLSYIHEGNPFIPSSGIVGNVRSIYKRRLDISYFSTLWRR
jgi:hypothetical protein